VVNNLTLISFPYTTTIDQSIPLVYVDVTELDRYLLLEDDDGISDLDWLNDFKNDREIDKGYAGRKNRIGLTEADFIDVYLPRTNEDFRELWDLKAAEVFQEIQLNPQSHIVFQSSLYGIFPWLLMPLPTGTPVIRLRPCTSIPPDLEFSEQICENGGLLVTEGSTNSHMSKDGLFGWNLAKEYLINSKLSIRGIENALDSSNATEINSAMMSRKYTLESPTNVSTKVIGGDENQSPSIWWNCSHGSEYGIQLSNKKDLRGDLVKHIARQKGIMDLAFLHSCYSLDYAHRYRILEHKIRSVIGHTGMADESIDVLYFEISFIDELEKGKNLGQAFFEARNKISRNEPASGSFQLIGDPRIILLSQ